VEDPDKVTERIGATVLARKVIERPARLLALMLGVVLVGAVGLLGGIAWREMSRIERIRDHLASRAQVWAAHSEIQHWLLGDVGRGDATDPAVLERMQQKLAALRAASPGLDAERSEQLTRLARLLRSDGVISRQDMAAVLETLGEIAGDERRAEAQLLNQMSEQEHREVGVVIVILAMVPVLGLVGYWNLRQRILKPLIDLRDLLAQLGSGAFHEVSPGQVHPALVPVFQNYNHLVTRLQALEAEHESRARSLESEVRVATGALLEQQRTLARAERLAVAGEMAAALAHELRNPLAGVLMSLENLRRDVADPDLSDRFSLVIAEIERLTRLLNDYLSTARHAPETPRAVRLGRLVDELLALLRYQVPNQIRLESDIPTDLQCRVPRDRLRQALLNLVINSVQALGTNSGHVLVAAKPEDGQVVLSVSDDGPGFPPALLRNGVQPFASRRESGTGLGLAMVRRFALDVGGEVYLDNIEPQGARVRLVLTCDRG
jgi:two-component system, NtrC family, sensor kinase